MNEKTVTVSKAKLAEIVDGLRDVSNKLEALSQ